MNLSDEAVLLWPLLLLAARNQQILSYAEVEGLTGIIAVSLGKPLGLIDAYCQRNGFPRLNVLVVSRDEGLPGKALPKPKLNAQKVMIEQSKAFVFDWHAKPKPRRADFLI
jgi:hypothetical protein